MNLTTDQLSSVTGLLMAVHVSACVVLRVAARNERGLLAELTELPMHGLALAPKLLRIRYYFPWIKQPNGMQAIPRTARAALIVARASGLFALVWLCVVFPVTLLSTSAAR